MDRWQYRRKQTDRNVEANPGDSDIRCKCKSVLAKGCNISFYAKHGSEALCVIEKLKWDRQLMVRKTSSSGNCQHTWATEGQNQDSLRKCLLEITPEDFLQWRTTIVIRISDGTSFTMTDIRHWCWDQFQYLSHWRLLQARRNVHQVFPYFIYISTNVTLTCKSHFQCFM